MITQIDKVVKDLPIPNLGDIRRQTKYGFEYMEIGDAKYIDEYSKSLMQIVSRCAKSWGSNHMMRNGITPKFVTRKVKHPEDPSKFALCLWRIA